MPIDLSIIIVSWNVSGYLSACLASIYRNIRNLGVEVIVVDNASRDDTVEMVRSQFPQARLIANGENAGFCRGNNQGLAAAAGRHVVLLNPDTEVYEGSMEALAGFLDAHPDVGVVGPQLVGPDGLSMPNGTRFTSFRQEALDLTGIGARMGRKWQIRSYGRDDFSQTAEVDVVCGACLYARREVFEEIGGLDERFFMYFEEVDFCLRARKAGWRVFYVPDSQVYHHWMKSAGQDMIRATARRFRSEYLYFRKHHGLAQALALRALSLGVLGVTAARIHAVRLRNRIIGTRREAGA